MMAASVDLRCHEELQELQEQAGRSSTVYRRGQVVSVQCCTVLFYRQNSTARLF